MTTTKERTEKLEVDMSGVREGLNQLETGASFSIEHMQLMEGALRKIIELLMNQRGLSGRSFSYFNDPKCYSRTHSVGHQEGEVWQQGVKDVTMDPPGPHGVKHADCLLNLGDSIPPAGSTHKGSPAVQYVLERGIATKDFTSYGSHRGFKRIHCICGLGIKKKNGGENSCIFQNSSTSLFF